MLGASAEALRQVLGDAVLTPRVVSDKNGGQGGKVGCAKNRLKPQKENNQRKSFKKCVFGGVNRHVLDGN